MTAAAVDIAVQLPAPQSLQTDAQRFGKRVCDPQVVRNGQLPVRRKPIAQSQPDAPAAHDGRHRTVGRIQAFEFQPLRHRAPCAHALPRTPAPAVVVGGCPPEIRYERTPHQLAAPHRISRQISRRRIDRRGHTPGSQRHRTFRTADDGTAGGRSAHGRRSGQCELVTARLESPQGIGFILFQAVNDIQPIIDAGFGTGRLVPHAALRAGSRFRARHFESPASQRRAHAGRNAPFENILIGRNEEIAVPDREKILSGPRLRDFERLEDMLRLRRGRLETPVGIDDSVDIEVGVMVLAASEIAAVGPETPCPAYRPEVRCRRARVRWAPDRGTRSAGRSGRTDRWPDVSIWEAGRR